MSIIQSHRPTDIASPGTRNRGGRGPRERRAHPVTDDHEAVGRKAEGSSARQAARTSAGAAAQGCSGASRHGTDNLNFVLAHSLAFIGPAPPRAPTAPDRRRPSERCPGTKPERTPTLCGSSPAAAPVAFGVTHVGRAFLPRLRDLRRPSQPADDGAMWIRLRSWKMKIHVAALEVQSGVGNCSLGSVHEGGLA
jgi:hypothetical protein